MGSRLNGYLSSDRPIRTHVSNFRDLAKATIGGIEHDEFSIQLRESSEGGLALAIASETRHHSVAPIPLHGTERPGDLLEHALGLIREAMAEDASYRFRFMGIPIFAHAAD